MTDTTDTRPPGGYTARACGTCWTGISWTGAGWTHDDRSDDNHAPVPPPLPEGYPDADESGAVPATATPEPLTKERFMEIHGIRPDEVAHVVDSNGDQPECIDDCPGCEPKPFAYTCTDGAHRLTITPDPDARDYYGDIRPVVHVAITDVTADDAEPAVVSVWGPDAGTVATAIRTAGRVSLGETEPQATADNPDDDALIQALSDAGAICGDCGSEPGDRYCEHCERARRWYVDAARRAGWLPRTEADHPLDDMTPQTCPAGLHADWAVDSESTHTCPWCENEQLLARVAELEARPDRATPADPWQAATAGLNALCDARALWHLTPDCAIANLSGPERIEYDRDGEVWRLVRDEGDGGEPDVG